MDKYEAAWKAFKASLMAAPTRVWTTREILEHLTFLELDFKVGLMGELLESLKARPEDTSED